jgi:hypothetical protein
LEARHQLRQQKAPALLEKIKTAIEAARAGALPGGLLAKAGMGLVARLLLILPYWG